jgi:hypothetical protein
VTKKGYHGHKLHAGDAYENPKAIVP